MGCSIYFFDPFHLGKKILWRIVDTKISYSDFLTFKNVIDWSIKILDMQPVKGKLNFQQNRIAPNVSFGIRLNLSLSWNKAIETGIVFSIVDINKTFYVFQKRVLDLTAAIVPNNYLCLQHSLQNLKHFFGMGPIKEIKKCVFTVKSRVLTRLV